MAKKNKTSVSTPAGAAKYFPPGRKKNIFSLSQYASIKP